MDTTQAESVINSGLLSKPKHLSPSTISSFIERRHEWYMNKVAGVSEFTTSDFLQRGKAIETGLAHLLEGGTMAEAVRAAIFELHDFQSILPLAQQEKIKQHEKDIPYYLTCAIEGYSKYGAGFNKLEHSQFKIELKTDACSMPIMGYVDFKYTGFWTDLKVLARKPSALSQGYCIQGVVYHMATGQPGVFTILVKNSPKKGDEYHFYEEHILKQEKPWTYWRDYMLMACSAIEGVYNAAYEGNVDKLIKHMSFPNLDSMYSEQDVSAALKYWERTK